MQPLDPFAIIHHSSYLRGGRKRLPKFKFSAKFPIGFTCDFTNTDKKIRKWLLYYVKNYFNRKSVKVQPCTPLEIMLNGFFWKLYGNTYAVHVTVALVGVATLNLALPAPLSYLCGCTMSPSLVHKCYMASWNE